ncbi:hypothetical protein ACFWR9_42290 [Streptomyces sp. NPDC058534]|uniref:hypothetical protein n=1 Tax=Streptomyces sp. NPDC058534 TaxID=3346541 RepID=UPI00364D9307
MRRRARALLAQVWEMLVIFGRLSAGENPVQVTGSGQGSRPSRQSQRSRPPQPAGHPATLPGHPERVPSANESTPESRAFWAQVALTDEIPPPGRRGPRT